MASIGTPEKVITLDDIEIKGAMNASTQEAEMWANYEGTRLPEGGWYGPGRKEFQDFKNRFRVNSPLMVFQGTATAKGNVQGWEVGFIQNIYSLTRTAIYTGNVRRELRQNPQFTPIRDGDEGEMVWYDQGSGSKKSLIDGTPVTVKVDDDPYLECPLKYTGQPTDDDPFEEGQQQLTGTDGGDQFKTFFAAVNETSKSILVLGGVEWDVAWKGTYNKDTKLWTPQGQQVSLQIVSTLSDNGQYPDLNQSPGKQLPFSPHAACGFENYQIKTGESWHSCKDSGKLKDITPSAQKWY